MKFIGWLLGFIVLLLVLVVAAGAGLIYYVHNTDQRALAQNILKDQTKLEVTFGEELSIKLWPQLEVRASGIRIADHFNDETPLVSVEQLHVLADWRDVLQRKSLAEQVVISRPQVDLYRRADGRANWEPPRQGRSSGGSPDVLGLLALVQHVEVSDAGLTMVDETVGQRQVWSNFQLGLGATSDTARRQLNVTGLVDGQPLTVRLSFDASHAKRLPLEAEVRAPSVVLSANGVVRGLPSRAAFNGTITAESADLVPLLQRFQPGMALPVTTLPFSLQTEAELSAKVFNLQSFNLSRTPWGDFRGQMALELGKLPYQFTADITSDNLNMAPFGLCGAANQRANQGSSAGRTSTAGGQQTPWSSDPIDVSFVQLVQGQLSFNALGFAPCTGWPLQSVRLAAEWDDQRLALSQLNLTNRVAGSLQASGQLGLTPWWLYRDFRRF